MLPRMSKPKTTTKQRIGNKKVLELAAKLAALHNATDRMRDEQSVDAIRECKKAFQDFHDTERRMKQS
jgi:hypothetical protein